MDFEFDRDKAVANLRKHGVSFDEAITSLFDPEALAHEDTDSLGENRWVLLGMSNKGKLLVVVYTLRKDSIRIISARSATNKEQSTYAKRI